MQDKNETVILGAGLSGLSTAYHLRRGYSIYDKEDEPGGMARSIHKDGYTFDYDGHLLHFKDEYVFKLVSKLLNGNLAPHKRNSFVYSKRTYTRYPFQANFYGLPKSVIKDCLIGLMEARINSYRKADLNGNFENWIKKTFGDGIAEHFMLPYNRKFWTREPREITCEWLGRFVPVPNLEDIVTGAISDNLKPYGYNSRFWYPLRGGISELAKGFLEGIQNTSFNKKAVTIDQYRREIIFEDGTIKRFKRLVNTIPLPELPRLLVNLPDTLKEAFSKLSWTSIFVVNLGIKRDEMLEKHWIYYPEEDTVFFRIGFPSNFSLDVAPPKKTSIYAEISYSPQKYIDKDKAVNSTIESLEKFGIISGAGDIEVCVPLDIKYGYVIYDPNRTCVVKVVKDYLKRFNIYSIGRYGSWRYMSMEDVILEGKETAECLLTS
jgi:protoporphyrinogen oxidase